MPVMTTKAREGHKLDLAVEVLRSSGAIRLQALGTSMLPSIWPGDVLLIQRRELGQVRPGDTAFFSCHGPFPVNDRISDNQGRLQPCEHGK